MALFRTTRTFMSRFIAAKRVHGTVSRSGFGIAPGTWPQGPQRPGISDNPVKVRKSRTSNR
jgi:hypothetical protein